MKNFIVLSMLTMVLMGCPLPVTTTTDTVATVDIFTGWAEQRAALEIELDGILAEKADHTTELRRITEERADLLALPRSSSGPDPRIAEIDVRMEFLRNRLTEIGAREVAIMQQLDEQLNAITHTVRAAIQPLLDSGVVTVTVRIEGKPAAVAP